MIDVPLLVEARGLWKTYHSGDIEHTALRGVDFTVARGEMVAIMGPSGCGKTTLLHCLAGLDTVDQGEVRIAGTDLARMSDRQRTTYRARHMGFAFQSYNLLPVLSAAENVELPLLVSGTSGKAARMRALAALEDVGLTDVARHRPGQLSGGQQQRVAIARALVAGPEIIWADEPTGNLDSSAATGILDLFQRLNTTGGHTIVLVTHAPDVSERAGRVVRMRDGVVVGEEAGTRAFPSVASR